MSVSAIMSTAITGLNATQAALRTTSNNITNVNTEGYERKVVELASVVNAGTGAGVTVAEITRLTDLFLTQQVRKATSDTQRYDAMADLHERFQALLGSPEDNSSVAGRIDQVFEGFSTLPIEPDSLVRRTGTVNDLKNMADNLTLLAAQIQELRAEADRQIGDAVTTFNTDLSRIAKLNLQITQQKLESGTGAADLEGQLDGALSNLAEFMDIDTFKFGADQTGVTGAAGLVLVDQLSRSLSYTSQGTTTSGTKFSQIALEKIDPVTGIKTSTGEFLDPNLTAGRLKGLIEMRDEVLPNFARELGEFAAQVNDQLNAIHNDNTSVPPAATLTGRNTGLVTTDANGFTGVVTFVTLDASNNYVNRLEVDFTNNTTNLNGAGATARTLTTIADVVTEVNTRLGASTLTFAGGVMTYAAPAGATGVTLYQDATSPSSRGGRGFSHFFGLNDLMQAAQPGNYDTGLTTGSTHGFGSSGIAEMQLRGPQGQTPASLSLDFSVVGSTVNDILTALNATSAFGSHGTFSLDSNGAMSFAPKSGFEDYHVDFISDTSARGDTKTGVTGFFGLGDKFIADAAKAVKVKDAIYADPKKLAVSKIDTSAAAIAGTVPALTEGDGRGAVEFQKLSAKSVTFGAAGHLAGVSTTLGAYAGAVLSDMATQASISNKLKDDRTALSADLSARLDGKTGVNLDEELANMVIYQNAYNAAARLISTAREMFDTLLTIAG